MDTMVKNAACTIALFLVVATSGLQAQIFTLYSSRPAPVGARAAGMGDAYAAEPYDATSMYWNPASVVFLQNRSVVFSHLLDQTINGMNENAAIPLWQLKGAAIAIGLTVNHVGKFGNTSSVDFRVVQYGYDIAIAKEVIPTLSFGVGLGVRYGQTTLSNLWGISSSFGAFYSPSREITYGVTLSGVGSGILYVSDRVTTTLSSENLPRTLQAAVSMRFPHTADETFLTISVANEKVFGVDGIRYQGGVEAYPVKFLALRWGYTYQQNLFSAARYGLGIRMRKFQLDYAISPSTLAERSYQFSLGFFLWGEGKY
jgi:hypothetical protein